MRRIAKTSRDFIHFKCLDIEKQLNEKSLDFIRIGQIAIKIAEHCAPYGKSKEQLAKEFFCEEVPTYPRRARKAGA